MTGFFFCMYVNVQHAYQIAADQKEAPKSAGTRVMIGCEPPHEC